MHFANRNVSVAPQPKRTGTTKFNSTTFKIVIQTFSVLSIFWKQDMLGNETLISNITHLHEILAANQDVLDIYLASAPNVILL